MNLETEITTFRSHTSDGREIHYSDPAIAVGDLGDEVLEQVKLLGEQDPNLERLIALGLPIDYMGELNKSFPLDARASQDPGAILHPLLTAFSRFLYAKKDELFQGGIPTYIRARASNPKSVNTDAIWHCDGLATREAKGNLFIRMYPSYRRLVVSLDTLLRDEIDTNVQFVDGEFEIGNVTTVTDNAQTFDDIDNSSGTIVTSTTRSVIRINDSEFRPDPSTIRSYGKGVITDLGCTTLHASQELSDAMRVSLQCIYVKQTRNQ